MQQYTQGLLKQATLNSTLILKIADFNETMSQIISTARISTSSQRAEMISNALRKVEDSLVHIGRLYGVEEQVSRTHFRNLEPHLKHCLLTTGL